MKLRTIIAEDEYPALRLIEDYVKRVPELVLIRKFQNGRDLSAWLRENEVDLIILDIQMPYLTGLEVIHALTQKPQIILTTAFDKYAVLAFELEVTDYLLKPISFDRFLKAAKKAHDYFAFTQANQQLPETPLPLHYIMVRAERQLVKINVDQILYIQSMAEYVKIVQTDQSHIITHDSLKNMESMLDHALVRIHKSYLVSVAQIKSISSIEVCLAEDVTLPLGASFKDLVKSRFK
jgi:DNA-binding LytR/AlgR family response regulator